MINTITSLEIVNFKIECVRRKNGFTLISLKQLEKIKERLNQLEGENQDLKNRLDNEQLAFDKLFESNQKLSELYAKLKQALDILKDKFNLKVQALHLLNSEIQYELQLREHCTTYCFSIPKDIYELLKEVLGNES